MCQYRPGVPRAPPVPWGGDGGGATEAVPGFEDGAPLAGGGVTVAPGVAGAAGSTGGGGSTGAGAAVVAAAVSPMAQAVAHLA